MSRSLSELYDLLERLKAHVCSWDERESGCPVCEDEKQIEHEIRMLGGRKRTVHKTHGIRESLKPENHHA